MKKLLAFILVFMMMFSIAACGGKTDKQSDGGTSDKGGESAISNLGFENADDAQRFVENFNSAPTDMRIWLKATRRAMRAP